MDRSRTRARFAFVIGLTLALLSLARPEPVRAQDSFMSQGPGMVIGGDEQRLANWSVRLDGIVYGDMAASADDSSTVSIVIVLKNITDAPQNPGRVFSGHLNGYTRHRPDQFHAPGPLAEPVEPGGEIRVSVWRRLSPLLQRGLTSLTLNEYRYRPNERDDPVLLASVDVPVPPQDPNWTDPQAVPGAGPGLLLANWSARVVSIHHNLPARPNSPTDLLVAVKMRNVSNIPRSPHGHFEWQLMAEEGPVRLSNFNVREGLVVPPGGEFTLYAHKSLISGQYGAIKALALTEHAPNANGYLTPRTVLARVELPLPPPPQ